MNSLIEGTSIMSPSINIQNAVVNSIIFLLRLAIDLLPVREAVPDDDEMLSHV